MSATQEALPILPKLARVAQLERELRRLLPA